MIIVLQHVGNPKEQALSGRIRTLSDRIVDGYLPSLTHRDFRLLWVWAFVSNIGTWVHNVALGLYIHQVYRSPGWLGLVNFCSYAPTILLFLPAGSIADTHNRKRILMVSQAVMMAGALSLAVFVLLGKSGLPGILFSVSVMGMGIAFNFPAWLTIVPELVPRRHLFNAVSLNAASWNLARFMGPMLASLIILLASYSACFFVNSISFLPFILVLLVVAIPRPSSYRKGSSMSLRTMTAGLSYARRHTLIRDLLLTFGIINAFALPYVVFIPVFGKDTLGRSNLGVSALYAAAGLGAVIGAPIVTRLSRTADEITIVKGGVIGISVSLLVFSWSTNFWLSLPMLFCAGFSFLIAVTAINTTLQLKTDPGVLGRVMSIYVFMLVGAYPVGGAVLGIVANKIGMPGAMSMGALICMYWVAVLLLRPELMKGEPEP